MKVVVLGTRGFPNVQGGVEAHCENLYPLLARKGCEVTVFTRKPYVDVRQDNYKGVRLIPLACLKNKFLEAFLHTFCGVLAARKQKADIIHIHAVGPSLFIPLARLLGHKTVMTNHGPDYERKKWGRIARIILRAGESSGSKWADAIISISESNAERIRNKYKRDVTFIPNGVVMPEPLPPGAALKKYGLSKGKYILAVGRFVPEKGFHNLIKAFEIASGSAPGWRLAIAGGADHQDSYSRELKRKAGQSPDIVLTGFITGDALKEVFSNAGLFVLPSYYEGLPIALLEALSYGLSCIASDIAANREAGLSEDRFFKPGDIEALAAKISEFMNKPLTEEEKSRQLKMAAERYNWENIAAKTLEVYKRVISDVCICS